MNKRNIKTWAILSIFLGLGFALLISMESNGVTPIHQISVSGIFPEMDLDFLSSEADNIVIAKVKEIGSAKLIKDEKGEPFVYTDYILDVEKDLKKSETPQTLVISQAGGSAEGYSLNFSDAVELKKGDRLLLFIHQGNKLTIIGGNQGKYLLKDGKAINKNSSKTTTEDELVTKFEEKIKKQ